MTAPCDEVIEMSQRMLRVLGTLTCALGVVLAGVGRAADKAKAVDKGLSLIHI